MAGGTFFPQPTREHVAAALPLPRRLLEAAARALIAHADELNALDRAIGDGDHGVNMLRGAQAVLDHIPADAPLADALANAGMELVLHVGGASGPLYGTLLTTMATSLPARPDVLALAVALERGIAAVAELGRSAPGQKSLLDTLAAVHAWLAAQPADGDTAQLAAVACDAARATIPMRAGCGRAAFLGARSIGHMDPGAWSAALITAAVCEALTGEVHHA